MSVRQEISPGASFGMPGEREAAAWLRRAWMGFVIAGVAVTVLYFRLDGVAQDWAYEAVGAAGAVAMLLGVKLHRPRVRRPWQLLAIGLFLSFAGDMTYHFYENVLGVAVPFPSAADVFYLAQYGLLMGGLLLLIRHRRPGRDGVSLIDALILATAAGAVVWVVLMAPYATAEGSSLLVSLVSIAYPLLDLVLAALLARMVVGRGLRLASCRLLLAAFSCYLVADCIYAYTRVAGIYESGVLFDAGWLLAYTLLGAAALHPSMARVAEPVESKDPATSSLRLGVLGGASLVPSVLLAVEAARGEDVDRYVPAIVVSTVGLTVLAGARMWCLLRTLRANVVRETVLREAAAALVVSDDRESICRLGVKAALDLMSDLSGAHSVLRLADGGARPAAEIGEPVSPVTSFAAIPLAITETVRGTLEVTSSDFLPRETRRSLDTLASEIALALERADLTEDLQRKRAQAEQRLLEAEDQYKALVEHVPAVVYTADFGAEGQWFYVSPEIESLLGYTPEEWMGDGDLWLRSMHPDDRDAQIAREQYCRATGEDLDAEYRMTARDGRQVWVRDRASVVFSGDGKALYLQGFMTDTTETKSLEAQLEHQAFHDPLTNLANRNLFVDRVGHALTRCGRSGTSVAVLFLDLDDFKLVNDTLGHTAGDRLLMAVADRLQACLRPSDTAARLGGDEFAVLVEDVVQESDAVTVAERISDSLLAPFEVHGKEVFVQASIGVAGSSETSNCVDDLLRNADVAMYRAKGRGKRHLEVFEPAMHSALVERLELTADLQRALEEDEFVLYYQPVLDLKQERIASFEALVRWKHPDRGLLAPTSFIPLAEETSLVLPLGEWVMEQACRQVLSWQQIWPSDPPLSVSVNVSARQLAQPELVDQVADVLRRTGFDAHRLVLEITESVLMQDKLSAVKTLDGLRGLGVRLALDDFGTGYSSLSYLRQFPIDILKIDKSFVDGIGRAEGDIALVRAVLTLGDALEMNVIAEGIETPEQLDVLLRLGCAMGQGFLFSPPLDSVGVNQLLVTSGHLMSLRGAHAGSSS